MDSPLSVRLKKALGSTISMERRIVTEPVKNAKCNDPVSDPSLSPSLERLPEYDTFQIDVASIYFDPDFNCRNAFAADSVKELAQSIEVNGLQTPVTLQPASEVLSIPERYSYRLVAGHRRFIAVTMFLKWTTIPAVIRTGLEDAARYNLLENLDRADLNAVEEAYAVKRLYPNASDAEIARSLNRSSRWVANRRRIMDVPECLHNKVAIGMLTLDEVAVIARYHDEAAKMSAARKILRAKVHGKKSTFQKPKKKVVKNKDDIARMMKRLTRSKLDGFPTRLLGWTIGAVTDSEIERDIKKATKNGK